MADLNAGEGFWARLSGIWIPELVCGSGKLETPWSRIQVANLTPSAWSLDVAACGLLDEPHAASTSAQPMAASAIVCRNQLCGVGAISWSEVVGSECWIPGYDTVTPEIIGWCCVRR